MKPVIIKADSTKIDPMLPEAASRKRKRSNLDLVNENHVDGYETSDESGNSLNYQMSFFKLKTTSFYSCYKVPRLTGIFQRSMTTDENDIILFTKIHLVLKPK